MNDSNAGLRIDLAVRQFIDMTFPNREPGTFPDLVIQALDYQDERIEALARRRVMVYTYKCPGYEKCLFGAPCEGDLSCPGGVTYVDDDDRIPLDSVERLDCEGSL